MNLLELNDIILYGKKSVCKIPMITDEDLILFKKAINISPTVLKIFESTNDSNSFFAVCPDVKKIVGASKAVECFYAVKLGYYMKNVPMRLIYIINELNTSYQEKYVNVALNSAIPLLSNYAKCRYTTEDGKEIDLKTVIENVYGRSIKLINSSVRKVEYDDAVELYVPDDKGKNGRVALLCSNMAKMLSPDDCEKVYYNRSLGITLKTSTGEIPIRTLGNRLGITKDEFDLRECV